jgi:hypothetical protein
MRHHFRRPQAMFNKGSLFYSHCANSGEEEETRRYCKMMVGKLVD